MDSGKLNTFYVWEQFKANYGLQERDARTLPLYYQWIAHKYEGEIKRFFK